MNEILNQILNETIGFKIKEKLAKDFYNKNTETECLEVSKNLFQSKEYQVRSYSVFILGYISSKENKALQYLKNIVSRDENWRVQEILAKAFDTFCSDIGYRNALPVIKEWLSDENPNVRRAVTEGLRIWTGRDYFKENPAVAVELLSQLKNDESEYVRKSVGNALRDISKKHVDLIKSELEKWDFSNNNINQTYKLASKFINRQ